MHYLWDLPYLCIFEHAMSGKEPHLDKQGQAY